MGRCGRMNVMVTVRGTQTMDGECDHTEQTANGRLERCGQKTILSYADEEVNTTLTVTSDKLIIDRRGEMASTMTLQVGMTHLCDYQTPYGALTLGVTTYRLDNRLGEHGGTLYAAYRLDMGGGATENEIEIIVKEVSC